ncbi:amidohydrolase family protein [Mycobacteroides franklinii]|uniref:Amidohydrolase n=1 Tax=Mycobacteroides franklinii TaxID=948102 RepID=A0A4R8QTG3_9MYCO|nr:amidohydrolase family protein [Mycobacteroides franklinii]TDZ44418.1 Amidohydrolase [Mycobacteroides franklinii]TDZ47305.1 Amidohydrolase [Mycobacteroides franklinii]TDZ57971.1 Amidohydrolase [Mycobacteroides franklinii]TDZ64913.1 Amidohydrolase [Mycobacteroides franklinii]TDZ71311.1 Amidohydrolase [Mycobacteroides franklinii]
MTLTVRSSPASSHELTVRVITLEEHFTTPEHWDAVGPFMPAAAKAPALRAALLDLDEQRIAAMDAGGVDVQVLSLASGAQHRLAPADATSLVRDANDAAFAATRRHPDRFCMFANLALRDPEGAASELHRGVTQLGCVGGFLNGTEGGSFLDDRRYTPIFEAASELDVPLYLHPTPPPRVVRDVYTAGLAEGSGYFLSTAAWAWHAELGLHSLRIIVSGVFDRHPALRLIVGHLGEFLPFGLFRAEDGLQQKVTGLARPVSEYFLDHFVLTTSGYFTTAPFMCARDVVGIDRLMYSVDHPYRSSTAGAEFLRRLPIPGDELASLTSGNAERYLKL